MSNGHFENPPGQPSNYASRQEREVPEESFESVPKIEFSVSSIAHEGHPGRNEDAVLLLPDIKVFGVFDGMGGREGGQEASKIAEETVRRILEQKETRELSSEKVEEMLREALQQAHLKIRRSQQENQELREMGTTASIVRLWEDEEGQRRITIANVGDSRVYRYSLSEGLEKITLDHDVASASIKDKETLREIQATLDNIKNPNEIKDIAGVSASEIEEFWRLRNQVTGMLGGRAKPEIYSLVLVQGERIIITSDGIHGNLT
ncbi:protein phosphatase 2C domain-containing protein, partial [Patescibacteria group bacterium]|nr:protein phosphatase 2C domain-containing protein [Patescibacteria group bacterium]